MASLENNFKDFQEVSALTTHQRRTKALPDGGGCKASELPLLPLAPWTGERNLFCSQCCSLTKGPPREGQGWVSDSEEQC